MSAPEEEEFEADDGDGGGEKVDITPEKNESSSSISRLGNPLYCSYIDGVYTYKDPRTDNEFHWDERAQGWNPFRVFGQEVKYDGDSYTYIDPSDGTTVYEWDAAKCAWFPKTDEEADLSCKKNNRGNDELGNEASSASASRTSGFLNPNYDNSSQQSQSHEQLLQSPTSDDLPQPPQPRRFYYAALSPTEMGVNEPVLFLSPDDQVNNNSTLSGNDDDEEEDLLPIPPQPQQPTPVATVDLTSRNNLPPGWERHEDGNGPYFWHIKSGTIQREPPSSNDNQSTTNNPARALLIPGSLSSNSFRRSQTVSCQLSNSASSMTLFDNRQSSVIAPIVVAPEPQTFMDKAEKRKSWSQYLENSEREKEQERIRESLLRDREKERPKSEASLRFIAVSLGCLCISEEDLTPERSSRAVSKVIAELTNPGPGIGVGVGVGKSSPALEVAGKIWGGGSELFLELDSSHLRVKTRERSLTVAEQAIHSIRVWGVGRDDPRDFAYVAREKVTRQFLCHVFRLEMNARPLASALRDACKKIMMERQQKQKRPTTLPTGLRKNVPSAHSNPVPPQSGLFPTPMDEPRKVIKAFYLGSKIVTKPTGMDILNGALDALRENEPIPVNVSVAPSVLLITSEEPSSDTPKIAIEIRVRYLSFMGIGHDVQTCGVIVHTARDDFQAHGFYSTPSSGALCKAIEAACVLRYQKCLDAHSHQNNHTRKNSQGSGSGGGSSGPNSSTSKNNTPSNTPSSAGSKAAANLANAFRNLDDEFLARYQLNYGEYKAEESSSQVPVPALKTVTATSAANNLENPTEESTTGPRGEKRKLPPTPPSWFEVAETQNTKVYVSNLPLDITEEEFIEFMSKCGLIMKDPLTGQPKIKLYTDADGNKKGDGLCTYIKIESIDLALQLLDGADLRGHIVSVERAKFQLKGQYDPTKKPKSKKRKEKERLKKQQEKLFEWKPEKLRGERAKHERIVIVKNAFTPEDFDKDVGLILEYQQDFREEAGKCGNCKKVVVFDRHPDGILQIFMTSPEEADGVIKLFNNRFFGGKKIEAFTYDGHTRYKIEETDAERDKRLNNWEKFIEEDEAGGTGTGEKNGSNAKDIAPPALSAE